MSRNDTPNEASVIKTRFTPGPWRIDGYSNWEIYTKDDNIWLGSVHGDHHTPGDRPQFGFPGNTEAEANANLIVTSPQLYEALATLYSETVEYISVNHLGRPEDKQS